jgi:hypothetical protein
VPEEPRSVRAQLPPQVEDLVASFRDPFTQIDFLRLIVDGGVLQPVLVDAATATRMVRPYTWLLDRVGAEGIKLTSAGYLPPVHVEAAVAELGVRAGPSVTARNWSGGTRVLRRWRRTWCWCAWARWSRTGTAPGRTGRPPTARCSPAPPCAPGRQPPDADRRP